MVSGQSCLSSGLWPKEAEAFLNLNKERFFVSTL